MGPLGRPPKPVRPRPLLIRGAKQLITCRGSASARRGRELSSLGIIEDGALLIVDGKIAHVGPSRRVENLAESRLADEIDASGRVVIPALIDPLRWAPVFGSAGSGMDRRQTYREDAARLLKGASARRLMDQARAGAAQLLRQGTMTAEARTLPAPDLPILRKQLRAADQASSRPDAAHWVSTLALWPEEGPEPEPDVLNELCEAVLPAMARARLAAATSVSLRVRWTPERLHRFCQRLFQYGFPMRIGSPSVMDEATVEAVLRYLVRTVDSVEAVSPALCAALARCPCVVTLKPMESVLRGGVRPPVRLLIEQGAAVALASGFHEATNPVVSQSLVAAVACLRDEFTPAEALIASTFNAAAALGVSHRVGSLEHGKQADLLVLDVPDYRDALLCPGFYALHGAVRAGREVDLQGGEADH
jgi:imidazolonepropionase